MAHSDPIAETVLNVVMSRVRQYWADAPDESELVTRDPALLRFGRVFQLWLLSKADVENAAEFGLDALQIASPSGCWHLELQALDSAAGSVTFRVGTDGLPDVRGGSYAVPGAPSIAPAVAKLEQARLSGDPLVRLLYAPVYNVVALWLIEEGDRVSRTLPASVPPWSTLHTEEIIESGTFLMDLARQESNPAWEIYSSF